MRNPKLIAELMKTGSCYDLLLVARRLIEKVRTTGENENLATAEKLILAELTIMASELEPFEQF